MLDTTLTVETPEGVELSLHIAGPVVRILAWAMDIGIRVLLYFFLGLVLDNFLNAGMGILLIAIFLLEWFYPVFFEIYNHGATPGKKRMGIKVLQESGVPVTWAGSVIRNLLRAVDFLPLFYGFGLLTMLLSRNFQRLGDVAAGTLVVYAPDEDKYMPLPDVASLPVPFPLTLEEQQALVHFAERAQTIQQNRVNELADIVSGLSGKQGGSGVKRLYAMANGLLGKA